MAYGINKNKGLGTKAARDKRRADKAAGLIPKRKGRKPAVPAREKQTTWNWFAPDGSVIKGELPVPGQNCEKIPDEIIYANPELRYCTNPECPSAQGENVIEGNKTIFVAGTPAVLEVQTVVGKDGKYSKAYFCRVCRTYQ